MQPIPLQVVIPPDLLATLLRDQLPDMIRQAVADVLPDMIRQAVADMVEASPSRPASFDPEDKTTRAALRDFVLDLLQSESDTIVSAIEGTCAFGYAVESVVKSCDFDENVEMWVKENPGTLAESLRDNCQVVFITRND